MPSTRRAKIDGAVQHLLLTADPNTRYETIQWVMWQMGGVGPMFGLVGFFNKFAGKAYEDKRPRDRCAIEQRGCSVSSKDNLITDYPQP